MRDFHEIYLGLLLKLVNTFLCWLISDKSNRIYIKMYVYDI